jgi:hypothetical protein
MNSQQKNRSRGLPANGSAPPLPRLAWSLAGANLLPLQVPNVKGVAVRGLPAALPALHHLGRGYLGAKLELTCFPCKCVM